MTQARTGFKDAAYIRQQWAAWRDDYRSERPEPVTCEGCQTTYQPHENANTMWFKGKTLIECGNCK